MSLEKESEEFLKLRGFEVVEEKPDESVPYCFLGKMRTKDIEYGFIFVRKGHMVCIGSAKHPSSNSISDIVEDVEFIAAKGISDNSLFLPEGKPYPIIVNEKSFRLVAEELINKY